MGRFNTSQPFFCLSIDLGPFIHPFNKHLMNSYKKHRVKCRFGQGGELNQDSAQTNPLGTYGGNVGGKERMESIHTTSGIPLVWTSLSLEHTSLGNCKQHESLQATTTLDYTWQGNPKTNPDIEMQEYLQSFFFFNKYLLTAYLDQAQKAISQRQDS